MAEYVDKDDVYRAAREYVKGEGLLGVVALAIFETAIDKLPAEDTDRHGSWLEENGTEHRCSWCKCAVRPEPGRYYLYCPYCGTRMDADL